MLAAGEGPNAMTPFGLGPLAYAGVPLLPEQTRDNLFTRFAYDFEGGIELETSLTYGKTESVSKQNSARQSWYGARTFFPSNAFLQPEWGTSQLMRDVFNARLANPTTAAPPNPVTMMGGIIANSPPLSGDPRTGAACGGS